MDPATKKENTMSRYIQIETAPDTFSTFPLDTVEQVTEAQEEMAAYGLDEAPIFVGDPECPDSYANGDVLRPEAEYVGQEPHGAPPWPRLLEELVREALPAAYRRFSVEVVEDAKNECAVVKYDGGCLENRRFKPPFNAFHPWSTVLLVKMTDKGIRLARRFGAPSSGSEEIHANYFDGELPTGAAAVAAVIVEEIVDR